MIFGILKDIKEGEYRVICTPTEVATIVGAGHIVLTQKDCGKQRDFQMKHLKGRSGNCRQCRRNVPPL